MAPPWMEKRDVGKNPRLPPRPFGRTTTHHTTLRVLYCTLSVCAGMLYLANKVGGRQVREEELHIAALRVLGRWRR
jgi:hypothetical protein